MLARKEFYYIMYQLNSVSSQCACGKSSIAQKKRKSIPEMFIVKALLKGVTLQFFKFCLGKLINKTFPHMVQFRTRFSIYACPRYLQRLTKIQ